MHNFRKLAFIGGGNMAGALVGGLVKRGVAASHLVVADPSPDQLQRLQRDYGIAITVDNAAAVKDAEVVVVWTERGGPEVAAPSGEGGYGSKLLNRSMTIQLGGSISCDWSADGVIISLQMTKDRLTR